MGYVHAQIGLKNPRREDSREVVVRALVDTAANHLCLPAAIVEELRLEALMPRTVKTADGSTHLCRYVGPIKVRFEDRERFVGALELGEEASLGAIPLEDMDLVVHPARQIITVNPDHPNRPRALVMSTSL